MTTPLPIGTKVEAYGCMDQVLNADPITGFIADYWLDYYWVEGDDGNGYYSVDELTVLGEYNA